MIKKIPAEIWTQLQFSGNKKLRKKYAISSRGRLCSYLEDVNKDGNLLRGSLTSGYCTLNLHLEKGNGTIYLHREIAKAFCIKPSNKHKFVLHINHIREDNNCKNLKWATMAEVCCHQQNSPLKIAYKIKQGNKTIGQKLNATKVKIIKKAINNPRRKLTYKLLAIKFGVSEMTIFRIKRGDNWGKIK